MLKKVLTITSSMRPKGNGKALLSICEDYISNKEGFAVKSINLQNYEIKDCVGCMKCAVLKEFCPIQDDLKKLLNEILACDILLIASPTYFLGAPAKIKAVNDRLLYIHNLISFTERKHAGIIITSGRSEWEGYAVQNVSNFLLSTGFAVKDVFQAYAQGPSEVLLQNNIKEDIINFVDKVLNPDHKIEKLNERCPICFGKSFQILSEGKVKCEMCNLNGTIHSYNNNRALILFSDNDINDCRWAEHNIKSHMTDWVEDSGIRYKEKIKDVMVLRKKLLNQN